MAINKSQKVNHQKINKREQRKILAHRRLLSHLAWFEKSAPGKTIYVPILLFFLSAAAISADEPDGHAYAENPCVISEDHQKAVDNNHDPITTNLLKTAISNAEHELVHFWFFCTDMPNNTPLEFIEPTYDMVGGALITYQSALAGYPFNEDHPNWRKASLERRNRPTSINYRPEGNDDIPYADTDMRAIQVRQPFTGDAGENILYLHLPTAGYRYPVVSFAAKDNGESEDLMAAENLLIDYTVDQDGEWITTGLDDTVLPLLFEEYQLYTLDFTGIPEVNDNPFFTVRIRFDGPNIDLDEGDRVVFNNIAMDADPMEGTWVEDTEMLPEMTVSPNPARDAFRIEVDRPGMDIRIYNLKGNLLHHEQMEGRTLSMNTSQLEPGMYIIRGTDPGTNQSVITRLIIK